MDGQKAIILFANPWAMVDEKTGAQREGITLEYILANELAPVVNEDGSKGFRHAKESLPIQKLPKILQVPGVYELQWGFTIQKGKPVMKLNDVNYLHEVGA